VYESVVPIEMSKNRTS